MLVRAAVLVAIHLSSSSIAEAGRPEAGASAALALGSDLDFLSKNRDLTPNLENRDLTPNPEDCATWADCRERARAAAAEGDYEAFHDLAWRAVQKGPRNDPELMLLLARAQSLSGRPLDALVMLGRLADMGIATGAKTSDEFTRVRALAGWADLEKKLDAAPSGPPPPSADAEISAKKGAARTDPAAAAAVAPNAVDAAPAVAPARAAGGSRGTEALRFATAPFTPAGLAYDAVSRRFIVGDRSGRRLTVIDEFSHQLANLAGASATGFGEITALEIDAREGDLWVASADDSGTRLHKLQLISARSLGTFGPPRGGPARFVDVAVTAGGVTLVLDAGGRRILRLRSRAASLEQAASLPDITPVSLAPAQGQVVYVAHENGLARLDLAARTMAAVTGQADALRGIVRLRAHGRALIAIQKTADGHRAVRLRLRAGGLSVAATEVLDPAIVTAQPSASSIAHGALYYLTVEGAGDMAVRRVELTK